MNGKQGQLRVVVAVGRSVIERCTKRPAPCEPAGTGARVAGMAGEADPMRGGPSSRLSDDDDNDDDLPLHWP